MKLLFPLVAFVAFTLHAAETRYETRAAHDPNGIGKFYMGREIAHVMGHQAADWLERSEREKEERTSLLIEALKVRSGDVIADIGAGTGYHTRRLAPKVSPGGRVYAVDIQPEMIVLLTNTMAQMKITNVVPVLGTIDNPKLPAKSVDLQVDQAWRDPSALVPGPVVDAGDQPAADGDSYRPSGGRLASAQRPLHRQESTADGSREAASMSR